MGKALYRKYRSKSLAEIIGQEHITTTLSNALKQGKVSHAYLFTGPRGVGKTSIARILAYELNGLPYDEGATHLDIIEIDAASNRRIDEIRELRDKVHTAPSSGKYKVYIIDEVHMLTREAFNALLKTLEEPPAHAVFILATTEAHKVPETIASRTQRFSFRPIGTAEQMAHLRVIAKQEKVSIDDKALELIASHSGGSFRDSISLLDQARSATDKVTLETVQNILGIAPSEAIEQLIELITRGSAAEILEYLSAMRQNGYQAAQLSSQLGKRLREQIVQDSDVSAAEKTSKLLFRLLSVPASHDPMSLLELILLEAALSNQALEPSSKSATAKDTNLKAKDETESNGAARQDPPQSEPFSEKKAQPAAKRTANIEPPAPADSGSVFNEEAWQQVLQAIKSQHNTLYGIARIALPTFTNDEITLGFSFPFHQKRFNEPKTRQLISDIIYKQTGKKMTVTCVLSKKTSSASKTASAPMEPTEDVLTSISNIFGDAEVLE